MASQQPNQSSLSFGVYLKASGQSLAFLTLRLQKPGSCEWSWCWIRNMSIQTRSHINALRLVSMNPRQPNTVGHEVTTQSRFLIFHLVRVLNRISWITYSIMLLCRWLFTGIFVWLTHEEWGYCVVWWWYGGFQIIHLIGIFEYKPTNLGCPHFRKPPYSNGNTLGFPKNQIMELRGLCGNLSSW